MKWVPFRFRRINLQQKFILVVVLFILLPVATAGVFFYISSEQYVMERTATEGRQTIKLLQKNVELLLQNYEQELMTLYQNEELVRSLGSFRENELEAEGAVNRFLREFLRGKEHIDSIYLFLHNSEQYFFYDQKGSVFFMNQLQAHPEWTQRLQDSQGETLWLSTYRLPANRYSTQDSYYFIGAMQIRDTFGLLEPLGVMMVNIKVEALEQLMSDIQVSPNGFLLLTDSAGNIVWHRNPDVLGRNVQQSPMLQALTEKLLINPGEAQTRQINGMDYEVLALPSIYNQWRYHAFVPHSDLNAEMKNIKGFMNITLGVSALIFSLLAVMTALFITKPLRRIVVAMNQFGEGKPPNLPLNANAHDEIGALQRSFNRMSEKIQKLIEQVRTVSAKEKEAELKALQAQINPHFVYNTLDTINWMAIERDETQISRLINSLSDIMRYAIRSDDQLVTVEEELKWAENYIHIQKHRFEDRFDVHFQIDERTWLLNMPRLLLQPIIENAIVHGMGERENGGLITILNELDPSEKKLIFVIEDNGSGMEQETLQQIQERRTARVGIQNTHDRIRLKYGAEYGLAITSQIDIGTKVMLTLPVIREDDQSKQGGSNDV